MEGVWGWLVWGCGGYETGCKGWELRSLRCEIGFGCETGLRGGEGVLDDCDRGGLWGFL
jgi:hypothetical protein